MTQLQNGRGKQWIKAIALVVVITFTVTTIAWADGGSYLGSTHNQGSPSPVDLNPSTEIDSSSINIKNLEIPYELGSVKAAYQGAKPEVVVHIQDAHVNEEAQRNIGRIIEYLKNKQGLKLVAIEGASGRVNTQIVAAFPDQWARETVADYYLAQGLLNGPEHAAITSSPDLQIVGVEDHQLYEENRKIYLDALQYKDRSVRALSEIRQRLDQISRFVFSDALRQLRRESDGYHKQRSYMGQYVRYLIKLAEEQNVSLYPYRQIAAFIKLTEMEKGIDFAKAEEEVASLVTDLKRRVPREESGKFMSLSIQFKLGKMPRGNYYQFLSEQAKKYLTDTEKYENVLKYLEYTQQYESLGLSLFQEVDQLEETVKNKLFRNESEVTLDRLYRYLLILEGIFDFSFRREDVDYF